MSELQARFAPDSGGTTGVSALSERGGEECQSPRSEWVTQCRYVGLASWVDRSYAVVFRKISREFLGNVDFFVILREYITCYIARDTVFSGFVSG